MVLSSIPVAVKWQLKFRDEKLQYDINWEAVKISALSSGKIDKHKFFTGKEILPSNEGQIRTS